jgi:hypothetical protein
MIISDLNHLEVVSEASSVVGGGKKEDYYKKYFQLDINKQSNVSVINQTANAESVSFDGKSVAIAKNVAVVNQSNQN